MFKNLVKEDFFFHLSIKKQEEKMKSKKLFKTRLPMEAVNLLRSRGGAHSSKKGKKGYDRKKEKREVRNFLQG